MGQNHKPSWFSDLLHWSTVNLGVMSFPNSTSKILRQMKSSLTPEFHHTCLLNRAVMTKLPELIGRFTTSLINPSGAPQHEHRAPRKHEQQSIFDSDCGTLNRAERARQEIRHRNGTEDLAIFQNKTARADVLKRVTSNETRKHPFHYVYMRIWFSECRRLQIPRERKPTCVWNSLKRLLA